MTRLPLLWHVHDDGCSVRLSRSGRQTSSVGLQARMHKYSVMWMEHSVSVYGAADVYVWVNEIALFVIEDRKRAIADCPWYC